MSGAVGYYVHHHGAGHWQRAVLVAAALDRPVTLIGSFAGVDTRCAPGPVLDLPDDRLGGADEAFDGRDGEASRPEGLHYAPLRHPGVRARMARIAAWAAETAPTLMIVDVSVEVTLLARLLSVPTLVVRLAGERTDRPHLEAFRSASRLLAPFPECLDGSGVPDWVRRKTLHAGFLAPRPRTVAGPGEDGRIVVLLGRGGTGLDLGALAAAARAVPERDWHVLGPLPGSSADRPANLHPHGWVAGIDPHLARAALVVGGAGDGVLAAVAAHGKRFLCLPEPRPYGEQTAKAAALAGLGAAVVHEGAPAPEAWRPLVARALALDPAPLARLFQADALPRLAAAIETIARRIEAGSGA